MRQGCVCASVQVCGQGEEPVCVTEDECCRESRPAAGKEGGRGRMRGGLCVIGGGQEVQMLCWISVWCLVRGE